MRPSRRFENSHATRKVRASADKPPGNKVPSAPANLQPMTTPTPPGKEMTRPITEFLPDGPPLTVDPHSAIAAQALTADQTRTVSPNVINDIKTSPTMRLSASTSIGGEQASVPQIGRELEAVAARRTSTAWVLWNHLAVFHLSLEHSATPRPLLKEIVQVNEWVCFPAGAGSGVTGVINGDSVVLNGRGSFSSGGRYADWAGVVLRSAMPTATGLSHSTFFDRSLNDPTVH